MPNFPTCRDGLYLKDDFYSNEGAADTTLGELRWEITTIGNAPTIAYNVTTAASAGAFGVVKFTTAATADGDGISVRLDEDGILLDGDMPGYFCFKAKLADQIASNNFRIGLVDSATATAPTVGIWVECDGGVVSLEADSADHGDVSAAAAAVPTLTSGTTMIVATWHTFEVTFDGKNAQGGPAHVVLYVDGYKAAEINNCQIDDDEEMELGIVQWQDSGGALAVELDLDFIELFISRTK